MLKFSESFHLHHNCCMTKQWRMAHPTRKAEEEAQTLSDGPCNAYQDNAPLMCTQHSRKPVHNTRYMLQVCLQRNLLQHSPYSKSNWFTEFCKSLCLSQFTASFISVWAKASIAECIDKLEQDSKNSIDKFLWGNCWWNAQQQHHPTILLRSRSYTENTADTWNSCLHNKHANDPSTGSPTETLLRLLLPLSDKAHKIYHTIFQQTDRCSSPNYSPDHSIGRSDGRCVQRAGT